VSRNVLVVFETHWDRPQIELLRAEGALGGVAAHFSAPQDADVRWDLDVVGWVAEEARRWRGRLAGVFSASDYPGAAAAALLAAELGLRGPRPEAVLTAAHKYLARRAQKDAAPDAVPPFALVDPDRRATWEHGLGYPCFAKPVKGSFSVLARRIDGPEELEALLTAPETAEYRAKFLHLFEGLLAHLGIAESGRGFLCEGLLCGAQVTVEGWCAGERGGILGVVDSTFAPGTRSFARFDYPSHLPAEVQERMGEIALRVARALGLEHTLFNVELVYDAASGRIGIIEINPRACGQFADLYAKVDGVHGYEVALALATGRPPRTAARAGPFAAAASFPLRAFEPALVRRAPDPERIAAVERAHPGTLVWIECAEGERLLDPGASEAERDQAQFEDGASHRYAVINLGGPSREDLSSKLERVRSDLGLELEPFGTPGR
jgi:biotin carboxylase